MPSSPLQQLAAGAVEFEREVDGRWIADYRVLPGAMAYGATPFDAVVRVLKILDEANELKEPKAVATSNRGSI